MKQSYGFCHQLISFFFSEIAIFEQLLPANAESHLFFCAAADAESAFIVQLLMLN